MTDLELVKWVHLLAAAVWTGGLIVLAFLVGAIRSVTEDRDVLRASARAFGAVSWTAMAIAIVTGTWMFTEWGLAWSRFAIKGTLIAVAVFLAAIHQITASRTGPALRGIIQLAILVVSIGIFGAAVTLI